MLTWGMMFFSTASWNNGGGGRSTAKKRNGDVVVLISWIKSAWRRSEKQGKGHASVNIEAGFLIAAKVRAHQYLLVLHAEVTLKCGKNHAYGCDVSIVRFLSGDVRLTRVLLLGSSEIFVQVIQEPA